MVKTKYWTGRNSTVVKIRGLKTRGKMMSYRFIEEFRDKYRRSPYSQKGEEIWIIGPAPSLDDYPKDFFDDKISIAVNYAYLAFPRATFFFTNHKKDCRLC